MLEYLIIDHHFKNQSMPKPNMSKVQKKMNQTAKKPSPGKPQGKNTAISVPKKALKKGR